MLVADLLSSTLIDSLYFSKYGLIKSRISNIVVKMMNFNQVSYGYSITNVGRMNIPTAYGPLKLEEVYGPADYSDVNEKLVGVVTVGGKVSFVMTYNEDNLGPDQAGQIREIAMRHLLTAVGK